MIKRRFIRVLSFCVICGLSPETVIVREYHCLCARPNAEFIEDIRDVIADGLFTDRKTLRNFRVAKTFRDQRQHFSLARG